MDYLTQFAEAGNQSAQYALAKLYLEEHNQDQAHYWFTQSTAQGNHHAQFFLDRWNEKKIAIGQKPDDHEDHTGPSLAM